MNPLIESIVLVVEVLENLNIPYFIGGSVASSAHGRPRATMDVDMVVDLSHDKVPIFCEVIASSFYVEKGAVVEAVEQRSSFNLLNFETMMKIDIFVTKDREFERDQFKRSKKDTIVSEELNSPSFYFCSPEDSILAKMEWYKLSNKTSDRQKSDIIGIIAVNKDKLDFNYIKKHVKKMNLEEVWKEILGEL